jgi:hypothetical protein
MGEKVIVNIKTFTDGYKPLDRVIPAMPWSRTLSKGAKIHREIVRQRGVWCAKRATTHIVSLSQEKLDPPQEKLDPRPLFLRRRDPAFARASAGLISKSSKAAMQRRRRKVTVPKSSFHPPG